MKNRINHFIAAVIVILIIPILPVLSEHWLLDKCKVETLTITAAIYSITVFSTSNKLYQLFIAALVSVIFCICYGAAMFGHESEMMAIWSMITIWAVVIIHGFERYRRHIIDREFFFNIVD